MENGKCRGWGYTPFEGEVTVSCFPSVFTPLNHGFEGGEIK